MAKRGRAEAKREMGMAPMTAFFKPVLKEEQQGQEEAEAVVEAKKDVVTDKSTKQEEKKADTETNDANEKDFVLAMGERCIFVLPS
eukprot:jgi/Picsp_1/2179/NSC_05644-R1_---NA---